MENLQISCICLVDLRLVVDFEVGKVLLIEVDYVCIGHAKASMVVAPREGLDGFDQVALRLDESHFGGIYRAIGACHEVVSESKAPITIQFEVVFLAAFEQALHSLDVFLVVLGHVLEQEEASQATYVCFKVEADVHTFEVV